jgi:plastocyanin
MRRPLAIVVIALASMLTACVPPTQNVSISSSGCAGGKIFCYQPAALTVQHGTRVVWKNNTGAPHTVNRCTVAVCGVSGGTGTDTNFGSPTINSGQTYAFTFHGTGTYRYYCKIHGYGAMHGTITVN